MSDVSRLEFREVDGRPRDVQPEGAPVVQEIPCALQRRFLAAALGFHQVRPWEVFMVGDVVDLDVPALAMADGGAMVVGDGERCRVELFVDRARAPEGRRELMVPYGLEVKLLPHARAELRAVDGAGERRTAEPRDYAIAIAALESLRLFVVEHMERLRNVDTGELVERYFVDVGQGSVEISVRFANDGSRGAVEQALELVFDGAA